MKQPNYTIHKRPFPNWVIPGIDASNNKVFVALDCEYTQSAKAVIQMGDRLQPVKQRSLEDVLSFQIAFNYNNKDPIQVFVHREPTDPAFQFCDILTLLRQYLSSVGVYQKLQKNKKAAKYFTIEMFGFWIGVDVSCFSDWLKVLSEPGKNNSSRLIAIQGNTVFTGKVIKLSVKDRNRHEFPVFEGCRLAIRDLMKLSPPKANLAVLGNLVNVPKIDVEAWDATDGFEAGYYKAHMDKLWVNRPQDFEDYAMVDTVITALYASFMLGLQDDLAAAGLGNFKSGSLKASLGGIVGNIILQKNKMPASWIVEAVIAQLESMGTHKIKALESALKPICKFTRKLKDDKQTGKQYAVYDYQFNSLFIPGVNRKHLRAWLTDHLDFDLIRKGYYFHDFKNDNSKHKPMARDITTKKDVRVASVFDTAVGSYNGGYNVCHVSGIIPDGGWKQDYDLVSAYNTNGHLIPDIAPALGFYDFRPKNLPAHEFEKIVEFADTINGCYTVGVGKFDIKYPADYDGFVLTPQNINDGPRYFKDVENVELTYTDAYASYVAGAEVFTHELVFPYQAVMDTVSQSGVCQEGIVQDIFQQRRAQYPKGDALNIMNKNIGLQVYGVTGQGLKMKSSRDFNNARSYFTPFSNDTSPYKAAQYTSITRLHIIYLQQAIQKVDSKALFLNNVTDGLLTWSSSHLSVDLITSEMDKVVSDRYRQVVNHYFKGRYIEEKDGTDVMVANLKSRTSFSEDGKLKAMVGINPNRLSPQRVFGDYLNQHATKINWENRLISGVTDMKHRQLFHHLQSSWEEPVDLYLGYDFAQWPREYYLQGQYVYWLTRPYQNLAEYESLQEQARLLMKYAPWYSSEYAPYFQQTLSELERGFKEISSQFNGQFVRHANGLAPVKIANELYENWTRYVFRKGLNVTEAYRKIVDVLDTYDLHYFKGDNEVPFPSTRGFLAKVKARKDTELINYVLLHKVNLI